MSLATINQSAATIEDKRLVPSVQYQIFAMMVGDNSSPSITVVESIHFQSFLALWNSSRRLLVQENGQREIKHRFMQSPDSKQLFSYFSEIACDPIVEYSLSLSIFVARLGMQCSANG